jgi:hypothetical protein
MDERRHDAVGVDLEIIRRVMLELVEPHVMALVRQPLFLEGEARLLGAGGKARVIELEHAILPTFAAAGATISPPRRREQLRR